MFILWKQLYLAFLLRRSNTRGKKKETKEFLKDTRQVVSRSKVHALSTCTTTAEEPWEWFLHSLQTL